jgi:hypothetical protein
MADPSAKARSDQGTATVPFGLSLVAAQKLTDHLLAFLAVDPGLGVLLRLELQGNSVRLHAIGRRHKDFVGSFKPHVLGERREGHGQ